MKFGLLSLVDHYAEDRSEEQYYKDFFDEELGMTHFWVYMDLGGLEQRELLRSMERFTTRGVPQFRGQG